MTDETGPAPAVVLLDRAAAEVVLRHLAANDVLDPDDLDDAIARAVETALHLRVKAFVDLARDGGASAGFSARVAQEIRDQTDANAYRFPEVVTADDRTRLDFGIVESQAAMVREVLDEHAGGDARSLRGQLPPDGEFSGPCALVEALAGRFSRSTATPSAFEARCAYGPFAPEAGPVFALRLQRIALAQGERSKHQTGAVALPHQVADPTSQEPFETVAEADGPDRVWEAVDASGTGDEYQDDDLAFADDAFADDDEDEDVDQEGAAAVPFDRTGALAGLGMRLSMDELLGAFRRMARDPLPTSRRDADRQIYLVVTECLATSGVALVGIGVPYALKDVVVRFVADGDRDALHAGIDDIAAATAREDLEQRTTRLLAEPMQTVCTTAVPLSCELVRRELSDPALAAWVSTVAGWRQDLINAGKSGTHPAPRRSIYEPDHPDHLDDWFKKWAQRQGRAATVWYSAAVLVALLSR